LTIYEKERTVNVETRIFVSGATGTTGARLVDQLLERSANVKAGVRSEEARLAFQARGVEAVLVDLADVESIRNALSGVEKAFSLSPLVPDQAAQGLAFVEAARLAGVRHLVRASAFGADAAEPAHRMNEWHGLVEQAVKASGIPYTIVRPNYFMQNYAIAAGSTIRSESAFYLPHGGGMISLLDARDLATVVAKVLTEGGHEGKAYDLTGPVARSNHSVAHTLSRAAGRPIAYVDVPEEAARSAMREAGIDSEVVEGLLEIAAVVRTGGYISRVTPDFELVTGVPATSFERFAEDHRRLFAAESEPEAA
jgi:uncharacterized protein YbjT (DUF2867 family)